MSNPKMEIENSELNGNMSSNEKDLDNNFLISTQQLHVRFNPNIVAYPSPNIHAIHANEEHKPEQNDVKKGIIEYMLRVQDKSDKRKSNTFCADSSSKTQIYLNQTDNRQGNSNKCPQRLSTIGSIKNWNLVKQKFDENKDCFFSKQSRVQLIINGNSF